MIRTLNMSSKRKLEICRCFCISHTHTLLFPLSIAVFLFCHFKSVPHYFPEKMFTHSQNHNRKNGDIHI